ncbi:DUF3703 domain-containing protein [Reichenbachiella agarivorans]|uniref:DUF3703 domain-containing protein n=1 Tax=Reichenbachiella agarivorans TaxID=2979464 RepID=A0ABY6CS82_9BACT|nr:DUF3703 domain-containing protein [Reichenbachiella agarivorans]UXP32303.1 DUF3703 domain-containing protein [Reichenbachiella agarivorans]
MKLNTSMPKSLLPFYERELTQYKQSFQNGALHRAWTHLERAHVIGQKYPYAHSYVHWEMLKFGFKIKSVKEILGQIPRLLVGGIKSFVGKVPVGNTGGSNVPPMKSLPISPEIQEIFVQAGLA